MKTKRFLILSVVFLLTPACRSWGEVEASGDPIRRMMTADDAVILALRAQTGIALDLDLVKQLRRLLRIARTAKPAVLANIHAANSTALNAISLYARGQVAVAFEHNLLHTGVAALDALDDKYRLVSVLVNDHGGASANGEYELLFKEPMNTRNLAQAIEALKIGDISFVSPEHMIPGQETNIYADHTNDGWVFTFILREDDCPAGCILRHKMDVLVDERGNARVLSEVQR